jgi:hypothetical protein
VRIGRKVLSGVVGLSIAAAVGIVLAAGAVAAPPTHAKVKPGGVQAFWTPKRMQRAVPVGGADPAAASADEAVRRALPPYIS